jgi:hypothetical protein
LFPSNVSAQELSLSISPPILEVMVQPGKEVSYPFIISNQGVDTLAKIKVLSFTPTDEFGNVQVLEKSLDWIKIVKPNITFDQSFWLKSKKTQEIVLKIAPPADTPEKDYYLTFLLESQTPARIGINDSQSKIRIGSNILLTISKDGRPYKKAKVVEFWAPKLVDSLLGITYKVRIKNIGAAFFKPIGKIIIEPTLGKTQTLKLAPQNILASSTRQISCLENETLTTCRLPTKIHLGFYQATLEFNLDDSGTLYHAKTQTLALPFSLIFGLLIFYLCFKLIKDLTNNYRQSRI